MASRDNIKTVTRELRNEPQNDQYYSSNDTRPRITKPPWAIQGSFANCNISVDLDLFNEEIIEYI